MKSVFELAKVFKLTKIIEKALVVLNKREKRLLNAFETWMAEVRSTAVSMGVNKKDLHKVAAVSAIGCVLGDLAGKDPAFLSKLFRDANAAMTEVSKARSKS